MGVGSLTPPSLARRCKSAPSLALQPEARHTNLAHHSQNWLHSAFKIPGFAANRQLSRNGLRGNQRPWFRAVCRQAGSNPSRQSVKSGLVAARGKLSQLTVLRFGFFQNGNVRVCILEEGEKLLVHTAGRPRISRQHIRSSKLESR
jgi:hypothetical protein